MKKSQTRTSKFLSLVLRHRPETVGITLDDEGWVDVGVLLDALKAHGSPLSREALESVVEQNDKKRFVIRDGKIRANQGHSVKIELRLRPTIPPSRLYHGTATRFLDVILEEGLKPMGRRHVHLSSDLETAVRVGRRHGKPAILLVETRGMVEDGFELYLSENGVWLTERVPPEYLLVGSA